ncbi:MAG: VWA domain-containing protein [Methylobacillus sp.]|jgi:mxaL protein|nr:VWA domain-containing protein [Methylobacillus sp.]
MKHRLSALLDYLKHHRDFALLGGAGLLLLLALFRPTVQVQRDIYTYLLVVDITQSMNTVDMTLDGKPVSRNIYTRRLLHNLISGMPCGTRVSVALFAGTNAALQYSPIEVCANFNAIQDNIEHMEWRMAWSGNSRLRQAAQSIAHLTRTLGEPSQVVFFTDGEEAPRLHAFNTLDLSGFQEGKGWLIVGIGSEKGAPIPKYDENNKLLGYWSAESFQVQPGVAEISQQNFGARDSGVALLDSSRQYSKLDEEYLLKYAEEIGSSYVRGDGIARVQSAITSLKPARRDMAPMEIHRILAAIAGLLLIAAYFSHHPWRLLRRLLHRYGILRAHPG